MALLLNLLQRHVDYLLILRVFTLITTYLGLVYAQLSLRCASFPLKTYTMLLLLVLLTIYLLNEYL